MRRNKAKPTLRMEIWLPDGDSYYVDHDTFNDVILACGNTVDEMKRKMGVGYHLIGDLLAGKRITGWEAAHVGVRTQETEPYDGGVELSAILWGLNS